MCFECVFLKDGGTFGVLTGVLAGAELEGAGAGGSIFVSKSVFMAVVAQVWLVEILPLVKGGESRWGWKRRGASP